MTRRWGASAAWFCLVLLASALLAPIASPQSVSAVPSTLSEAGQEAAITSTNISLVVDSRPFENVQHGKPFPIAFELSVIDAPLAGTLEIEVAGQPTMVLPVELLPPASQQMMLLGWYERSDSSGSIFGGGSSGPPAGITFSIQERGKTLLRQRYDLIAAGGGNRAWGELTSQILLLQVVAPQLQIESPVNGITPARLMEEVDDLDTYSAGGSSPTTPAEKSPPIEAGPPVVIPLANGGYPLVGAYSAWDTLFVHGQDPHEWSAAHIAALQDWVLDGGVLLLSPGAAVDWNPWAVVGLDDAPRIESADRPVGTLAGLDAFFDVPLPSENPVIERFALPGTMEPLVLASDGAPLLGWRRYGRGCIVAATFDLTHPSIRGWSGLSRLLQWMCDWGSVHRANATSIPGSVAAMNMNPYGFNMAGYGYGAPAANLRQQLSIGPLVYGKVHGLARHMPVLLWFLFAYALALLILVTTMRSHGKWRPVAMVWGAACAGSLLLMPLISRAPLVLFRSAVPVTSPNAPGQVFTGGSLFANRGQFGARFTFPEDQVWRPVAGHPEEQSTYAYDEGGVETPETMQIHLTHPPRVEHLDLPLSQRRFFVAQEPPRQIDPGFSVSTRSLATGEMVIALDKTDATFAPNVALVATAWGLQTMGGISRLDGSAQGWPHEITLSQVSSSRDVVDHPERYGEGDGYTSRWDGGADSGEDGGYQTSGEASKEMRQQRVALRTYAQPMRGWVEALGGLLVVMADMPDPRSGDLPDIRVWFDPTPLPQALVRPVLRFGHSEGVALHRRATRMQLDFEAGGTLLLNAESAMQLGELFLDGTPTVAVRSMVLEQWSLSAGWVPCARLDPPDSEEPPAWSLLAEPSTPRLQPLYRLRATVPVTVTQCLIPDFPAVAGLTGE